MEQVLRKFYNRKHTQIQRHKLQTQIKTERRAIGRNYKGLISKKYQQPFTPSTDFSLDQQYRYKRELQFGNSFLLISQNQNQVDLQIYKSHQNTFFLPKIQKSKNIPQQPNTPPLRSKNIIQQPNTPRLRSQNILQHQNTSPLRSQNIFQQPNTPSQRQSSHQLKVSTKNKTRKNLKLIFRAKVIAVIFIERLKKHYKYILIINKREMQNQAKQFLQIVNKTVNMYYVPLLKEQLNTYFRLLQVQIRKPAARLNKQILDLISQITAKLAKSTIRKDLLLYLTLVSQQNSFFPSGFLTKPQISRLDFNLKFGCLRNVTEDQSRMIVGLCLGIKIFCVYIIYKPWMLNFQHPDIRTDAILKYYNRAKKLIFQIGSVFYNIIIQQYLQVIEVRPKQKDKIKLLRNFNLKQLQTLNVIPQNANQQEKQSHAQNQSQNGQELNIQIINNQTKDFYSALDEQFPEAVDSIRINIIKWLDRIALGARNQHKLLKDKKLQIRKKEKMLIQDKISNSAFNKKLAAMKL